MPSNALRDPFPPMDPKRVIGVIEKRRINGVKLPAHRAGLPGYEISFFIVPLDPTHKAGLAGHLPVKKSRFLSIVEAKTFESLPC
jgi:hypothetical protein